MCGIAGIVDPAGRQGVEASVLDAMTDSLSHRGPDGRGTWIEGSVGLGHRRLAIIDLSAAAEQPLFDEAGDVGVVFNGEIYNYAALMAELQAMGYVFRSRSDTEVIVHAWSAWGSDCVQRLRGMFAFALWDRSRGCLFLARDRVGIKPLHYAALPDGRLLFASELKAIKQHPAFAPALAPEAVADYFAFGYVPDPRTIYRSVYKLEPGHTLLVEDGRVGEPRQYWDMAFEPTADPGEVIRCGQLRDALRDAVTSHLVSDVPVGAFLSGGVDSSAVVALMADGCQDVPHTTSIAFGEAAYDEAEHAQRVAQRYGTRHHVARLEVDALQDAERIAALYDEPYADSSALPTERLCRLARDHTKVVLSGDGGDETFAGYRRYRFHRAEEAIRRPLPLWLRRAVFKPLARWYPALQWAPRIFRARATFRALAQDSLAGYLDEVAVCSEALRSRLFTPAFQRQLNGYHPIEVLRRHDARAPAETVARVQYLDFKTYLPGDILTKVDRASMAHSLEVRVPILDHAFLEWAGGLTARERLRGGEGKYLFKRALRPLLDDATLYRRKQGFAVPLAEWFRGPWQQRLRRELADGAMAGTGWIDMDEVVTLVHEHADGRADHSAPLWALWQFEHALRADAAMARAPEALAEVAG